MRVCIVGHFSDTLDEGSRIVAKSLARELNKKAIYVNTLDVSSLKTIKEIFLTKPEVIHFVLTPTWQGVIISWLISLFSPRSKTLISAMHPSVPPWKFLKFFQPNVVLVQSNNSQKLFESIGFSTSSLMNGVDIRKFRPVDAYKKKELRSKYGIPDDKFVILHLASLSKGRNLDIFKNLQKASGNLCLIIGRENEKCDEEVVKGLKESGCQLWVKHFPNIEDIYAIADCYLFPTIEKKACIETPLSVLEAMACNLPVISTEFGTLPQLFRSENGIFFIKEEGDYAKLIEQIKNKGVQIKTREMVVNYSWDNTINALQKIYEEL